MRELFKTNIKPVSLEKINSDKSTKPPEISLKRPAGRPNIRRVRKRNKPVPKIIIVCSKCGQSGHNVRTCEARKKEEKNSEESFL